MLEPDQPQHADDARSCVLPPRGGEHASSMFSNTDRLSNTLGVWNLRQIPRLARAGTGSGVMRSPWYQMSPALGRRVTRDHADEGGLAGAVRPDDATQLVARELEIDVVGGDQP